MKNKFFGVTLCMVLLMQPFGMAQNEYPGNYTVECASWDHCADRVESRYRQRRRECSALKWTTYSLCVSSGLFYVPLGMACSVYAEWQASSCYTSAKNECVMGIGQCNNNWNRSGMCHSGFSCS